jgi:AcrR family transcriptional regulator
MPKQADPKLESRILDAAQRLWTRGGEKALTMRAVARAAHTTTPTVYQRFRNRQDILRALVQRIQGEYVQLILSCRSMEEICRKYVERGLDRPYDYQLFYAPWAGREVITRNPGPGLQMARRAIADEFGGAPEDHTRTAVVLWSLLHGVVSLLNSRTLQGPLAEELKAGWPEAVQIWLGSTARRGAR